MTYAEKKKAEAAKLEDDYAAPAGLAADPDHALTEDEKYVIENKGTEAARTGKYDKFYPTTGYFACRKCGAPIYSFQAKFDSGCGWPAFDKCYEGSITAKAEDDGTNRIEIVCAGCNGHLGHVFKGEGFTETGERHCARGMLRVASRTSRESSSSGAGLLGRTPWASARLEWTETAVRRVCVHHQAPTRGRCSSSRPRWTRRRSSSTCDRHRISPARAA